MAKKEENVTEEVVEEVAEDTPQFNQVTLTPDEVRYLEASELIRNRVGWSLGAGLVPIPVVDLVALLGIQLSLVQSMAKTYNVPYKKNLAKSLISSLLGSVIPVFIAGPVASVIKVVPVIGYTTSAITMSLIGGASTYAIGKVFLQHFESGGTLLDFDTNKMKGVFKEKFKEGKKVAEELKAKEEEKKEAE